MTRQSKSIRIRLLEIAGKVEQEPQAKGLPQGLKCISELEISIFRRFPESCYALKIPNIFGEAPGIALGVFGLGKEEAALDDVYALGLAGQEPIVCKVVKSDAQTGSSYSNVKNRRKSFMTPTPLHIPESQVSPIPDSAHEMIYLKGFSDKEALKVVPLRDVVWMHPLISVVENPQE